MQTLQGHDPTIAKQNFLWSPNERNHSSPFHSNKSLTTHSAFMISKQYQKGACHIKDVTCTLVICLIYPHSPSGAAHPQESRVYIRQITGGRVTNIFCMGGSKASGCQESVEWNGGMEYWNGIVE